jgi:hypothetical protein
VNKVDTVNDTANDVEKTSNANSNVNNMATEEVLNMIVPDEVCRNKEYEIATVLRNQSHFARLRFSLKTVWKPLEL